MAPAVAVSSYCRLILKNAGAQHHIELSVAEERDGSVNLQQLLTEISARIESTQC